VLYLENISLSHGSQEKEANETMVLVSYECETNLCV